MERWLINHLFNIYNSMVDIINDGFITGTSAEPYIKYILESNEPFYIAKIKERKEKNLRKTII